MARILLTLKWDNAYGSLEFSLDYPHTPGGKITMIQWDDAGVADRFKKFLLEHERNPKGYVLAGGYMMPNNALHYADTLLQALNGLTRDLSNRFRYEITEYPDSLRTGRGGGDA